jgi:hypothetical protein
MIGLLVSKQVMSVEGYMEMVLFRATEPKRLHLNDKAPHNGGASMLALVIDDSASTCAALCARGRRPTYGRPVSLPLRAFGETLRP